MMVSTLDISNLDYLIEHNLWFKLSKTFTIVIRTISFVAIIQFLWTDQIGEINFIFFILKYGMFAHKPNTQINKLSENMFFNNIFWKLSTIQQHSRHVYVRHLNHVNYKQSLSRFISFKNFKEKKIMILKLV